MGGNPFPEDTIHGARERRPGCEAFGDDDEGPRRCFGQLAGLAGACVAPDRDRERRIDAGRRVSRRSARHRGGGVRGVVDLERRAIVAYFAVPWPALRAAETSLLPRRSTA